MSEVKNTPQSKIEAVANGLDLSDVEAYDVTYFRNQIWNNGGFYWGLLKETEKAYSQNPCAFNKARLIAARIESK
jgi:hypothetical protein